MNDDSAGVPGTDAAGSDYRPIRDYAAIGDCHGAALVSMHGSIDWCCLARFDADPVFARLVDAGKGGYFSIRPRVPYESRRAYLGKSNVLRTVFHCRGGKVAVTDYMPVGRKPDAGAHDYVNLNSPNWLVREVEGVEGKVPIDIAYRPTRRFGREDPALRGEDGAVLSSDGVVLYTDLAMEVGAGQAGRRLECRAGEIFRMVVCPSAVEGGAPIARLPDLLNITRAFWEEWAEYIRYAGSAKAEVARSALALKLMTYAPSGAIVAALTTSLPEEIGGIRNWDYRYCWLRDASFALYALGALGYGGEAQRFSDFLQNAFAATAPHVQIMYGIEGEADLTEQCLQHLDGYRGSRPVRVGNGAWSQHQADVYGQIMDWALAFHFLGGHFAPDAQVTLRSIVEIVVERWAEPDHGIWEMRGPPRHHLYGKLMSWVALDRGIRLLGGDKQWEELRDRIRDDIHEHGIDRATNTLLGTYGGAIRADAVLLLAPMIGFPLDEAVVRNTVQYVRETLADGVLVHRYRCDDGLEGGEGAFLICSFWLVDALLRLDRYHEARVLFGELLLQANDVGLYPEEIDPADGSFLGNFPQAYTHLALIASAVHLRLYEKDGSNALRSSFPTRAKRTVDAVLGWRAVVAAMRQCWRVGRIFSSRRSIMPLDLCR